MQDTDNKELMQSAAMYKNQLLQFVKWFFKAWSQPSSTPSKLHYLH